MTSIYVAETCSRPSRVARRVRRMETVDGRPIHWIFLGRDYLQMRRWQAVLGSGFKPVDYSTELQEIGKSWRRPYLDWIARFAKRYNSLAWWSSRLSERNAGVCPLFQNICYLHIAQVLASRFDTPLLILADSRALLQTLARQPDLKDRIRCVGGISPVKDWALWAVLMVAKWSVYLVRGVLELRDARRTRDGRSEIASTSERVRVLMHSCIDESYFRDHAPRDRYLTALGEELRRRGCEVITIPWLVNLRRSRREAFKWFRRRSGEHLIPEDYYTLGDYVWAARVVMKQIFFARGFRKFQDHDVELLLREAARQGVTDTGIARFVRYVRLIERLKARGFRFNVFVDKFENMVTEKPQVLALREFMPEVLTVGFQHYSVPYEFQLQLFSTPEESQLAPHPDVIVCNSKFCVDLFGREGFPASKLRLGPSLRYLYLWEVLQPPTVENTVLVILSLDRCFTAEMMHKLLAAFPVDDGIKFLLKLHPMMSRRDWISALGGRALPAHMSEATEEIAQLVSRVTCGVVGPATTAGVELLLAGIFVVSIGSETNLDMNPLTWFEDLEPSVRSQAELRDTIMRLCAFPETGRRDAWQWAEKHREQCLSPMTDSTIGVFLGDAL